MDVDDVDQQVRLQIGHPAACFLVCFPAGAFDCCFAIFQKAGRQRPKSFAGLNIPAAHEDVILPYRDAAHNDFGILIMDGAARRTDVTGVVIIGGNREPDRFPAMGAKIHALKSPCG
ncbi:hypothetical protein DESC_700252 [Desulfosarcina cetonica]|nr:hypothetical protein DESC_700252 [Desulfosarcina cetonica]